MQPLTQQEKSWATLCHVAAFAGLLVPFGHIVGPLVVWLLKRGDSVLVDDQGKEAINFQISTTLYLSGVLALIVVIVAGSLLAFAGAAPRLLGPFPVAMMVLGLLSTAALLLFDVIAVVAAAASASKGESYRYPLSIRFLV